MSQLTQILEIKIPYKDQKVADKIFKELNKVLKNNGIKVGDIKAEYKLEDMS